MVYAKKRGENMKEEEEDTKEIEEILKRRLLEIVEKIERELGR